MKKIKSYFSSHKKILLTTLLLIILLGSVSFIIGSYATNVLTSGNDGEYDITLSDEDNTISIPAHSAKTVYYKVENTTGGVVSYGVGYNISNYDPNDETDTSLGVYVKAYNSDDITGTLDYHEYKFIKLKIYNQTDNDDEVELSTILGYETGGDLIIPDDMIMIDNIINKEDATFYHGSDIYPVTSSNAEFLNTGIERKSIASVTIENDNVVSANAIGYSKIKEGNSLLAWWEENEEDSSLVDMHIGADYGEAFISGYASSLFAYLVNAKIINVSNLDISKLYYLDDFFLNFSSLIELDLSNFDTSKVSRMHTTFKGCTSLKKINLSNWNTSKVATMYQMFYGCSSLTSLDLNSFEAITGPIEMFKGCTSLKSIDLSNTILNSENLGGMFQNCSSLTSLDLSKFSSEKLTNTKNMFNGCSSLTNLNLSGFDFNDFTTNNTNTTDMFNGVTANIIVSSSEQKTAFESLFTTYDSSKVTFN